MGFEPDEMSCSAWLEGKVYCGPMTVMVREFPPAPYAAHWMHYNSWVNTVTHNVRGFRKLLDQMRIGEFKWEAYDDGQIEYQSLPDYVGAQYWACRVPLINWACVEWHHPDRVARQFGYVQGIPYEVDARMFDTLHGIADRRGKVGNAWLEIHARYIDLWMQKEDFVVQFQNGRGIGVTPEYWTWYMRITRRLISPPLFLNDEINEEEVQNMEGFHPPDVHLAYDVDTIAARMFERAMRIEDYGDAQQMISLRQDVITDSQQLRDITRRSIGLDEFHMQAQFGPATHPTQRTRCAAYMDVAAPPPPPGPQRRRRGIRGLIVPDDNEGHLAGPNENEPEPELELEPESDHEPAHASPLTDFPQDTYTDVSESSSAGTQRGMAYSLWDQDDPVHTPYYTEHYESPALQQHPYGIDNVTLQGYDYGAPSTQADIPIQ